MTVGKRDFSLLQKPPHQLWVPLSLIFSEYLRSFPELQRLGPEVDLSPPSSVEIKNEWSHTSTPLVYLHGVDRDNLTFLTYVSFEAVSACRLIY